MEKEVVLNILDELGEDEFKRFKFYLREPSNVRGKKAIAKVHLENAQTVDLVTIMVETYTRADVLEITREALIKMNRNDLVRICSSGLTGQSHIYP